MSRIYEQIAFEKSLMKFLGIDHLHNIQSVSIHSSVNHTPYAVITKLIGDGFHDNLDVLETTTYDIILKEREELDVQEQD